MRAANSLPAPAAANVMSAANALAPSVNATTALSAVEPHAQRIKKLRIQPPTKVISTTHHSAAI
jgi:hypothetical protein